jgi:hypothetical protein
VSHQYPSVSEGTGEAEAEDCTLLSCLLGAVWLLHISGLSVEGDPAHGCAQKFLFWIVKQWSRVTGSKDNPHGGAPMDSWVGDRPTETTGDAFPL